MTKKDYIAFAKMIKNRLENLQKEIGETSHELSSRFLLAQENEVETFANKIADIFADDNPSFDRSRFLIACGLEEK